VTVFALVAVILVAAGLAWVLRPLLARRVDGGVAREASNLSILRDQLRELDSDLAAGVLSADQHREAHAELERRVLEEARGSSGGEASDRATGTRTAIALAFLIPVAAVLLYLQIGARDAFSPMANAPGGGDHSVSQQEMDAMVAKLAERMRANPGDPEGWAILARSYYVLGRFAEAAEAYAKVTELVPADADLLADYADALAMAQGRKLAGKPMEIVRQALKVDPNQWKALALAGTDAFDRKDYRAAVGHWEKLRGVVPPDSDMARSIDASIAEARQLGGLAAAPKVAAAPAAAGSGRVAGTVSIGAALAAKADADDTVFIFARPADGPRMPLAIVRKQVKDLPAAFSLDDAMAMTPQAKLSNFSDIVVGARISKSGQAAPQSGDLEGLSAPVKVGASGVAIVIDRVLP
jgi:cytochrome c-type biogenesis protein CcmH